MSPPDALTDPSATTRACRPACVGVVDDDPLVRATLDRFLSQLGLCVRIYDSARAFLGDLEGRRDCRCLVVDVRMPEVSGLELLKRLRASRRPPAVILTSGNADVEMAVEAMRRGAADFLQKPFKLQQLLDSVQTALEQQLEVDARTSERDAHASRLDSLTPREHDVLDGLLRGLRSRAISTELEIGVRTVDEHRASIMRKMGVASIGALVALCASDTLSTFPRP